MEIYPFFMNLSIDFLNCKKNKTMNRILKVICVVFILIGGVACNSTEEKFAIHGKAQGTTFTLLYYANHEKQDLDQGIFRILESIDNGLSTYQSDSYISKWNRNEPLDTLDQYFKEMYLLSKEINEMTNGYFDPTVQPLSQYYGFEKKANVLPQEIDSILEFVGFNKLIYSENKIGRTHPKLQLNYNAIAQGYTVDVVVDYLYQNNIRNFIFELGGEVYCSGYKPGNQKWIIGVDKPKEDRDGTFQSELALSDLAVTTSGNYRKWKQDPKSGKKYTHTINPHTGASAPSDLLSVTVIDKSCAKADAFSTALLSMKYKKATNFLENVKIPTMLILEKQGNIIVEYYNGFNSYIN